MIINVFTVTAMAEVMATLPSPPLPIVHRDYILSIVSAVNTELMVPYCNLTDPCMNINNFLDSFYQGYRFYFRQKTN